MGKEFEGFEEHGLSELEATSAQMHEVFVSFTNAGFTEDQALKLVAILINMSDEENEV